MLRICRPNCLKIWHFAAAAALVLTATGGALAATPVQFPQENPAFTFELPDGMKAELLPNGNLSCVPIDGSSLRGVFQPLPNIHNDRELISGLNQLVRLMGPRLMSGVQYPAIFNQDTSSGVQTVTASAVGIRDGKQYALAFIVFSKAGKYYELVASGATDTMTSFNFPHSFRASMKLTP